MDLWSLSARAYILESKIAQHPRIIVGRNCIDYLQQTLNRRPENVYDTVSADTARICLDLLMVDDDGWPTVDYLGQPFRSVMQNRVDKETVKQAYDNVIKFCEIFKGTNDTKRGLRLALLRDYFQHRLIEWEIDV